MATNETTRRALLAHGLRAGVVGAALLAPAAALADTTTTSSTTAEAPEPPPDALTRLLSIELLMLYTYEFTIASSLLRPRTKRALAPLRANEEAHVEVLRARLKAVGGVPPSPPASISQADRYLANRHVSGRLGQLKNAKDALYLLLAMERVTVGAYFVALTKLDDPPLITLAAEIMANDAQHEALIGELLYHGNVAQAVPYGLVQGVQ